MKRKGYLIELLSSAFNGFVPYIVENCLGVAITGSSGKDSLDENPLVGGTAFHLSCRVFNRTLRENLNLLGRSATTSTLKDVGHLKKRPQNIWGYPD